LSLSGTASKLCFYAYIKKRKEENEIRQRTERERTTKENEEEQSRRYQAIINEGNKKEKTAPSFQE
jgi:hypothetical protein